MAYKDPEQQRAFQREWLARRRQAWIDEHGPCVDCGGSDRLEVDHIDPALKVSHSVWSWSKARRDAELAKCVVRCYRCHKKKSATEVPRGSATSFAVLTEGQVAEARRLVRADGVSMTELGRRWGVKGDTVRKAAREGWSHISEPPVPVAA